MNQQTKKTLLKANFYCNVISETEQLKATFESTLFCSVPVQPRL